MSFTPDIYAPTAALLDRMEEILREGDALIHDPLPSAWPAGDPCPDDHYCLPEGTMLYRYDVPDEAMAEEGPGPTCIVVIGADGDMTQKHLDDDRLWIVQVAVRVYQSRDLEVSPGAAAALVRDLLTLFTVDAATQTAVARLRKEASATVPGVHVFHIERVDVKPDSLFEGRHGHEITFDAFCSGIAPTG